MDGCPCPGVGHRTPRRSLHSLFRLRSKGLAGREVGLIQDPPGETKCFVGCLQVHYNILQPSKGFVFLAWWYFRCSSAHLAKSNKQEHFHFSLTNKVLIDSSKTSHEVTSMVPCLMINGPLLKCKRVLSKLRIQIKNKEEKQTKKTTSAHP